MKKFLFIFLILIPPTIFTTCGNIDFTTSSGSNLLSLLGIKLSISGTAPNAPANLQTTPIATDRIDLVWENNSNNITGYRIERSAGNNTNFIEIASSFQGSVTSYNDAAGLNPGTAYYYRMRAYNTAGNSDYSNISSASTYSSTPLVPANPSILQASALSSSQINLTWHDNSDNEEGFNIEGRTEGMADFTEIASGLPAGSTTYTRTGLDPTTTYYFRVRAYNSSGNSGYSNEAIITICPEAPGSAAASAVSSTQINISWTDNSSNETGFRIERSTDNNTNYTEIAGNLPAGTTSYSSTGLTFNKTYYYRVRAYNGYGNSAYSNEASATTNNIAPYAPTGLAATALSSSQINLTWTDNSSNETGFRIEQSSNNVTFTSIATVSAGVTSYSNTGLSPNSTYYYRVRAYNGVGNSGYSNVSSAVTDNIAPAAPSGLTASAVSSSRINISWTDNSSNESGFRIERSTNNNSNYTEISGSLPAGTTSFSNTGLNPNTTYFYRVRAYNGAGNSGYSNETSATTNAAPTTSQIIADHTVVDDYDKIPAFYMAEVKKMWCSIPGESHSSGYRIGANLLEASNSNFAVNVSESGTPEGYTASYLRLSRASWGTVNSTSGWFYTYGEEDWFTSATAINHTKAFLQYTKDTGPALAALGFGWCWDMTWTNGVTAAKDQIYGCGWAGSSVNGPEGDLPWGLDAADQSITGNSVCLDTYLNATQQYIDYCAANGIATKVFFTTGPVDNLAGDERAYQRHLKQQRIRDYVAADSTRILFDYADILCWSNGGVQNTTSWGGHTFGHIHPDNMLDLNGSYTEDGDHIGQRGSVRLAKAMWWMLARIAGWDGI